VKASISRIVPLKNINNLVFIKETEIWNNKLEIYQLIIATNRISLVENLVGISSIAGPFVIS
jgi:hypothetical protein